MTTTTEVQYSCSHCHTLAPAGTCPNCGHDNDRARLLCNCPNCVRPTVTPAAQCLECTKVLPSDADVERFPFCSDYCHQLTVRKVEVWRALNSGGGYVGDQLAEWGLAPIDHDVLQARLARATALLCVPWPGPVCAFDEQTGSECEGVVRWATVHDSKPIPLCDSHRALAVLGGTELVVLEEENGPPLMRLSRTV